MLKLLALFIGFAHAQVAVTPPNPNVYLVFPTQQQALDRSQQQCQSICDSGDKVTKYWWNVVLLNDGTAAVEIQPSGYYSITKTVPKCAICGLTFVEQITLQTAAQLGSKLPAPVVDDQAVTK